MNDLSIPSPDAMPVWPTEASLLGLPEGCPGFSPEVYDEVRAALDEKSSRTGPFTDLRGEDWFIALDEALDAVLVRNIAVSATLPEGEPEEAVIDNSQFMIQEGEKTQPFYDFASSLEVIRFHLDNPGQADPSVATDAARMITREIHRRNVAAGWWTDLETGKRKERNFGELIALAHSEVSEAFEGFAKGQADDHLPDRPMAEVEIADTLIRLADTAGGLCEYDFCALIGSLTQAGDLLREIEAEPFYPVYTFMSIDLELSRALEAHRKSRPIALPLARAFLRLVWTARVIDGDVKGAFQAKAAYNLSRQDHRLENRRLADGKKI